MHRFARIRRRRSRLPSCARFSRSCARATTSSSSTRLRLSRAEVIAAVDASSHLCVVGMLDALSLKDTKIGLETLEEMGYDPKAVTLVLNRADSDVGITQSDVEQLLGRAPDVLVGSDRAIPRALTNGQPIVVAEPRSKAARSYAALAERYLDGDVTADRGHSVGCARRIERQRAAAAVAAEGGLAMELHERIASSPTGATIAALNGNGSDPFAELKNRIHLALVSELGPRLFDVEDGAAVRERRRGRDRRPARQETGLSRDDRRAPRSRDRRRHLRLRAARASARRSDGLGDHGQRPEGHLDRACRPAFADRTDASPTRRTCAGSSRRWWARSDGGSTSRPRWSTHASPTGRV